MLYYIHSNAKVEKLMSRKLSMIEDLREILIMPVLRSGQTPELTKGGVLLYSFLELSYFKDIRSFRDEYEMVRQLAKRCVEHRFRRLVILTHPGAYFNSANLYCQFRGLIEQVFMQTGIPCTFLNIQAVYDEHRHSNNLESLLIIPSQRTLLLPTGKRQIVQAVEVHNLCLLISRAVRQDMMGKFDVFDSISSLTTFIQAYSPSRQIIRLPRPILFVCSFFGLCGSPSILEVILAPAVPMYKFRTERDFGLTLRENKLPLMVPNVKRNRFFAITFNMPLKSIIPFE